MAKVKSQSNCRDLDLELDLTNRSAALLRFEADDGVEERGFRPKAIRPTAETERSHPASELVAATGFEPVTFRV